MHCACYGEAKQGACKGCMQNSTKAGHIMGIARPGQHKPLRGRHTEKHVDMLTCPCATSAAPQARDIRAEAGPCWACCRPKLWRRGAGHDAAAIDGTVRAMRHLAHANRANSNGKGRNRSTHLQHLCEVC